MTALMDRLVRTWTVPPTRDARDRDAFAARVHTIWVVADELGRLAQLGAIDDRG